MLSVISETQNDKDYRIPLICGIYKKAKLMKNMVEWWLPGSGGWKEWGDVYERHIQL